ncbi:purine nucleoside phosphorylase [Marinitoga sp. 1135]|uniref:purine-nucleoside phosphorylase n=1 Tax=unclassified Marinitoga TaxID=2640159 RepID=UPI00095060A6|nr:MULTISPECIES: purine-nucleoside phosphorylase [unclassified Marinitoga]APT75147.1 purine nucleoside phosphorylase [Marinitoga sp. 1137]NUU94920.1 purine nucleoside phosphorylase [Marinitoga sp. 1135]NUU96873.1 purine nucleoside phosphorylase [Marinitoga sp. 1138]
MYKKIQEAAEYIKSKSDIKPVIGLILGSGLGYIADEIEDPIIIDYKDIPHFPQSTVKGHAGKMVIGMLEGKPVITLKGRFHAYEGHELSKLVFPIYVFKELGVEGLVLTNAAGGVNRTYNPGDIVANTSFINFTFKNPLIGPNIDEMGPRFPSMATPIDRKWLDKIEKGAEEKKIKIQEGTYCWMLGPSYESPAEIKMLEKLEGDLVGMSTMPEIIAANHCGIKAVAFSAVTNMAAGILPQPLNHKEVMEVAERIKHKFAKVVKIAIKTF